MAKSESSKWLMKIKNKTMIPISFIFPKIKNKQGIFTTFTLIESLQKC
jgi:hypothetical protein